MKVLFDLHTHTTYSRAPIGTHGKGTVMQNAHCAAMRNMGVAISDHGPAHALYGVKTRDYGKLASDVEAANAHFKKRRVLLGIEGNITDEKGGTDIGELPIKPDVALMGYHKGVFTSRFLALCLVSAQRMRTRMTSALIAAMEKNPIDAITHPGAYVPIDMKEVAAAAAAFGVALELNERHAMERADVDTALSMGAHFILSSDAHVPDRVGVFTNVLFCCEQAGVPENRVANSDAYDFKSGLRLDRLSAFAADMRE